MAESKKEITDADSEPLHILKLYRDAKLAEEKEREIWLKCFAYVNNWVDGELGQWSTEARAKLKSQNRPIISFNEIRKFVNRICGAQRQSKADEKVYPRDDKSDYLIAEIMTDLLKYVSDVNNLDIERAKIFRDMIICGRGYSKCEWGDELDPLGEVTVRRINPFRVYVIGDHERYDLTDRDGVIEEVPMSKDAMIARWPEFEDEIGDLSTEGETSDSFKFEGTGTEDYGLAGGVSRDFIYDKEAQKIIVLRCQKYKWIDAQFIVNEATGERTAVPDGLKKKDVEAAVELAIATTGVPHKLINKRIKTVQISYSAGRIMLSNERSEYQHFDITGYFAYTDNGRITGIVQDLLDPQDEKNKRHAQIIHILGTAAKNSFFGKKGAVDDVEAVERRLGMTGQYIEVNGIPRDAVTPITSDLTAVPAIVNMDLAATAEMKEISGLGDASLGQVPQGVKSGRGIQALQGPGETIISEAFDNFFVSRKIEGKKIIEIMQKNYTTERRVRILGDYNPNYIPPEMEQAVASGLVSVEQGQKIITINKQIGEKVWNDITVGRFDLVIDHVASNPTARRAEHLDIMNMMALGAPMLWEDIFETSDIRGKQKYIAHIKEARMQMLIAASQAGGAAKPNQSATPSKAIETDLLGNTSGAQFG